MTVELLVDGPEEAEWTLLLAHGAGAPMDSDFMERIARGLGEAGVRVVRFEFPYMARRRVDGRRRPPDREAVLLEKWREMVEGFRDARRLAIGGKSMGGRMASMIADEAGVGALVCFGYPFHAPGRPDKPRTVHLETLTTPALIVQGARDPFGNRAEVEGYALSSKIRVHWIEDGDHDLKPGKASERSHQEAIEEAIGAAGDFLGSIMKRQV